MYKILLALLSIFFINQLSAKDMTKSLFKSIETNDIVSFKEILLKASDLNVVDDSGKTPILIATSLNHAEMVSLLLDKGVDPNILDSRRDNAYLLAGANGNLEILKILFEKSKIPVDIKATNRYGGTALIPACEKGYVETVRYLISQRVDINHVNNLGLTCLLEVVILGDDSTKYQDIVKILLQNNADINIKDRDGKNALQIASTKGFTNIEKLLQNKS